MESNENKNKEKITDDKAEIREGTACTGTTDKTIEKTQDSDPNFDIGSKEFNPLLAIYAKDFNVYTDKLKVQYQNFAALESAIKRQGVTSLNKPVERKPTKSTEPQPSCSKDGQTSTQLITADDARLGGRRFLPHQMPVQRPGGGIKKKHMRNLLMQMDTIMGPLAALRKYQQERTRIVVMVRNHKGVRGHIEGQLLFFDKHWNLLMIDVHEVWQRRKYQYGTNKTFGVPQDCSQRLAELGLSLSAKVETVKSMNRKNVQITRKIPQLLVRGEQVVSVRPAAICDVETVGKG